MGRTEGYHRTVPRAFREASQIVVLPYGNVEIWLKTLFKPTKLGSEAGAASHDRRKDNRQHIQILGRDGIDLDRAIPSDWLDSGRLCKILEYDLDPL